MFSLLKKVFGTANERIIKKLFQEVEKINELEKTVQPLSDRELADKTNFLRKKLSTGQSLDDITYEAFAVVREAARRVIGQRHYDVQLVGGLILHRGMVTEMRTGEGKTLVATLPAYLNALTGKGVHIVTVNDYLAGRDASWMGQIFEFLGLKVACITGSMSDEEKKQAYAADIIYATNNELGFDYLRDNMKFTQETKVQRPFNYAIIDEVDSILIDEARTPLIISGAVDDNTDLHIIINKLVKKLSTSDYEIDEKAKSVTLTETGINLIEELLLKNHLIEPGSSLYDVNNLSLVHYINQALRAHHIFAKDVDYLVKNQRVMIIDEFTGRIMDGRRYSEGLHQAIEAKENVPVQNENQTLASITFQNYFRLYSKLSGMTGTAMTEAAELKDIYNLDVISVPTHKKVTRTDKDDAIYGTKVEKYRAVLALIEECNERGQPVLVGTVSIEKSEEISAELKKKKIKHQVLNAKMHEQEAYVIAQAGRYKAVTIATNMAGRGTDIMLGGNPEMMIDTIETNLSKIERESEIARIHQIFANEKEKVLKAGGLCVIGTERHESRRIDNQLRGRAGRQGDPGFTQFFLSLEDDLMRIFASDRISAILRTLGLKDGEAIHHPMISRSLEKAQQKVEGHNYEIRKNVLKFDDVMNDQRKIIYEQRNEIIATNQVQLFIEDMLTELSQQLVNNYIGANHLREEWNLDELIAEIHRIFSLQLTKDDILAIEGAEKEISQLIEQKVRQLLEQKATDFGKDIMQAAEKYILLTTLDQVWKEHLHSLDHLRQGIQLRAYGQKDPLNEYKREAFGLFEKMLNYLRELFIQRLCFLQIDPEQAKQKIASLATKKLQKVQTSRQDPALQGDSAFKKYNSGEAIAVKAQPVQAIVKPEDRDPNDPSSWGKISRNQLCPCNSGKKYKHCHGAEL